MKRPNFIKHWKDVESPEQVRPPVMDEPFGYVAEFAPATGMSHLRVAHLRLPPGVRSHPPIASRDEDVFFFVLEGAPDLWADGHLYPLREGDGICFPARTGIAHSILNNTPNEVRLFLMSEAMRYLSKFAHPVDAAAGENLQKMGKLWTDAPTRKLGPHDGQTDAHRKAPSPSGARKKMRPDFVVHWRDILEKKAATYPNSKELQGIDARFGRRARFSRIGVHLEVLKPGRRTSRPHAERDEEEFVYVVSGKIDAWNDGYITKMGEGDFIGWEAGTGITHVIINNADEDAILIVGGEAGRRNNQYWYPTEIWYNKDIGKDYWADHPKIKLGPHDGLPDALRAELEKKKRKKRR
ncbi:MAG TPA: cupin domain-containing protein [Rhizomicrobium sp.]|nr:cupin domain-containing protein [Rhizomicrobium sp.]